MTCFFIITAIERTYTVEYSPSGTRTAHYQVDGKFYHAHSRLEFIASAGCGCACFSAGVGACKLGGIISCSLNAIRVYRLRNRRQVGGMVVKSV